MHVAWHFALAVVAVFVVHVLAMPLGQNDYSSDLDHIPYDEDDDPHTILIVDKIELPSADISSLLNEANSQADPTYRRKGLSINPMFMYPTHQNMDLVNNSLDAAMFIPVDQYPLVDSLQLPVLDEEHIHDHSHESPFLYPWKPFNIPNYNPDFNNVHDSNGKSEEKSGQLFNRIRIGVQIVYTLMDTVARGRTIDRPLSECFDVFKTSDVVVPKDYLSSDDIITLKDEYRNGKPYERPIFSTTQEEETFAPVDDMADYINFEGGGEDTDGITASESMVNSQEFTIASTSFAESFINARPIKEFESKCTRPVDVDSPSSVEYAKKNFVYRLRELFIYQANGYLASSSVINEAASSVIDNLFDELNPFYTGKSTLTTDELCEAYAKYIGEFTTSLSWIPRLALPTKLPMENYDSKIAIPHILMIGSGVGKFFSHIPKVAQRVHRVDSSTIPPSLVFSKDFYPQGCRDILTDEFLSFPSVLNTEYGPFNKDHYSFFQYTIRADLFNSKGIRSPVPRTLGSHEMNANIKYSSLKSKTISSKLFESVLMCAHNLNKRHYSLTIEDHSFYKPEVYPSGFIDKGVLIDTPYYNATVYSTYTSRDAYESNDISDLISDYTISTIINYFGGLQVIDVFADSHRDLIGSLFGDTSYMDCTKRRQRSSTYKCPLPYLYEKNSIDPIRSKFGLKIGSPLKCKAEYWDNEKGEVVPVAQSVIDTCNLLVKQFHDLPNSQEPLSFVPVYMKIEDSYEGDLFAHPRLQPIKDSISSCMQLDTAPRRYLIMVLEPGNFMVGGDYTNEKVTLDALDRFGTIQLLFANEFVIIPIFNVESQTISYRAVDPEDTALFGKEISTLAGSKYMYPTRATSPSGGTGYGEQAKYYKLLDRILDIITFPHSQYFYYMAGHDASLATMTKIGIQEGSIFNNCGHLKKHNFAPNEYACGLLKHSRAGAITKLVKFLGVIKKEYDIKKERIREEKAKHTTDKVRMLVANKVDLDMAGRENEPIYEIHPRVEQKASSSQQSKTSTKKAPRKRKSSTPKERTVDIERRQDFGFVNVFDESPNIVEGNPMFDLSDDEFSDWGSASTLSNIFYESDDESRTLSDYSSESTDDLEINSDINIKLIDNPETSAMLDDFRSKLASPEIQDVGSLLMSGANQKSELYLDHDDASIGSHLSPDVDMEDFFNDLNIVPDNSRFVYEENEKPTLNMLNNSVVDDFDKLIKDSDAIAKNAERLINEANASIKELDELLSPEEPFDISSFINVPDSDEDLTTFGINEDTSTPLIERVSKKRRIQSDGHIDEDFDSREFFASLCEEYDFACPVFDDLRSDDGNEELQIGKKRRLSEPANIRRLDDYLSPDISPSNMDTSNIFSEDIRALNNPDEYTVDPMKVVHADKSNHIDPKLISKTEIYDVGNTNSDDWEAQVLHPIHNRQETGLSESHHAHQSWSILNEGRDPSVLQLVANRTVISGIVRTTMKIFCKSIGIKCTYTMNNLQGFMAFRDYGNGTYDKSIIGKDLYPIWSDYVSLPAYDSDVEPAFISLDVSLDSSKRLDKSHKDRNNMYNVDGGLVTNRNMVPVPVPILPRKIVDRSSTTGMMENYYENDIRNSRLKILIDNVLDYLAFASLISLKGGDITISEDSTMYVGVVLIPGVPISELNSRINALPENRDIWDGERNLLDFKTSVSEIQRLLTIRLPNFLPDTYLSNLMTRVSGYIFDANHNIVEIQQCAVSLVAIKNTLIAMSENNMESLQTSHCIYVRVLHQFVFSALDASTS